MNYKPFNLEDAKNGHPLVTRDGRPVKFIAHVPEANEGDKVIALIGSYPQHYFENGLFYEGSEHTADLFMAPKRRTVWVNLYPYNAADENWFDSEEDANMASGVTRIGKRAWAVEIEE